MKNIITFLAATMVALLPQISLSATSVDGEVFENEALSSCGYTRDLTIGSTGSDVVALQSFLEDEGYLTMPAGVSKGYFGSLVQSAVASYQASVGISPANGYFGAITRSTICSEEVPSLPEDLGFPTSSRGALKAYVLSQVQIGVVNIQTKNSGNFQRIFVGETPQEIVDQIRRYDIEFETIRPQDEEIQIYVYLRGSPQSRTLFSGQVNNVKLQKFGDDDHWSIPNIGISLVMQENVPVSIPTEVGDVESVEVRIRDQYGFATKVVSVGHYNGMTFFPTRYAGEFGELVFIDSKGQEFSYDLETGEYLAAEEFEVEYHLGIENYKEETLVGGNFNDFWPIALMNDNGRASAPTYRLEVIEKTSFKYGGYVYHSDKAGEISVYRAKKGHLIYLDDDDSLEIPLTTNGNVEVELDPGKYMLWIEYEILEVPGYNSGGGKG